MDPLQLSVAQPTCLGASGGYFPSVKPTAQQDAQDPSWSAKDLPRDLDLSGLPIINLFLLVATQGPSSCPW